MSADCEPLLRALGYRFQQTGFLTEALRHRSAGSPNNERLEFLGDALLNWLIAEVLYGLHPQASEGDLTRLRASLVRESTLADIANDLRLGEYLDLGPGERRGGGFRRQSILADGLEALIAAVYLDGGLDATREIIKSLYGQRLRDLPDAESLKDAKTRLQEFLQGRNLSLPSYEVLSVTGEAHQQQFHVRCSVTGCPQVGEGEGSSRRRAEQVAAGRLLNQLQAAK